MGEIDQLPLELQLQLLTYVDYRTLLCLRLVNKYFKKLVDRPQCWRKKLISLRYISGAGISLWSLLKLRDLRHIIIDSTAVEGDGRKLWECLPNLKTVYAANIRRSILSSMQKNQIKTFVWRGHCTKLSEYDITDIVPSLTMISVLHLSGIENISDEGLQKLAALHKLKELNLSGYKKSISCQGLQNLLYKLPALRELYINPQYYGCSKILCGGSFNDVFRPPDGTTVSHSHCTESCREIDIPHLHLTTLTLDQVSDEPFQERIVPHLPCLKHLSIAGSSSFIPETGTDYKTLKMLAKQSLTCINVNHNTIHHTAIYNEFLPKSCNLYVSLVTVVAPRTESIDDLFNALCQYGEAMQSLQWSCPDPSIKNRYEFTLYQMKKIEYICKGCANFSKKDVPVEVSLYEKFAKETYMKL